MNTHNENNGLVVTAKGMTPEQLQHIEEQALQRYKRNITNNTHAGDLSAALAALLTEIASACQQQETRIFIITVPDIKPIIKSYLSRHKLSQAFPYKNAQLLDFVEHSDLTRLAMSYFIG